MWNCRKSFPPKEIPGRTQDTQNGAWCWNLASNLKPKRDRGQETGSSERARQVGSHPKSTELWRCPSINPGCYCLTQDKKQVHCTTQNRETSSPGNEASTSGSLEEAGALTQGQLQCPGDCLLCHQTQGYRDIKRRVIKRRVRPVTSMSTLSPPWVQYLEVSSYGVPGPSARCP